MKMIDVGNKKITERVAIVEGKVCIKPKVLKAIEEKNMPKGDVLVTAKLAGILAAKRTSEIIPLCHPIPIDFIDIEFSLGKAQIEITTTVKGNARTGVEMEAFTATAVSALTIYDMCKSLDREARILEIKLIKKTGGKSGEFIRG